MTGFPSEMMRALRGRQDREIEHLKSMCCILDMIEHMGAGDELLITAVAHPDSRGVFWQLRRQPLERTSRSEPPLEANHILMREIEERTDCSAKMPHFNDWS